MTTFDSLKHEVESAATEAATESAVAPHGKEVQFGDLILTFTTKYDLRWSDGGSGSDDNAAYYQPVPPQGFFALGSMGVNNYDNPDGKFASMCVKASASPLLKKPPLARPQRFEFIWNDRGSGADRNGSCWRPVPPDGYVALGDVFVEGYDAPTGDPVMCVARELVIQGKVGDRIWIDAGSGADRDFGSWEITANNEFLDTPDGVFAVNSFIGVPSHHKPEAGPVVFNLRLPLPTQESSAAPKPKLTSRNRPPANTNPVVDRVVTLPFTAVLDDARTLQWKVDNSPFYDVERLVDYSLLLFLDNETDTLQTASSSVTTGVSKEHSQTFSITTGISVTYESGVEAGGFSSKVSATISLELGYSSTQSVTQFRSQTEEAILAVAPQHAGALWVEANTLRVIRADGTPVSQGLDFDTSDTAYVISEFPNETPTPARFMRRRSKLQE